MENRAGRDQQQAEQALRFAELELWEQLLKQNISNAIFDGICFLPHITGINCITEFKERVVLREELQSCQHGFLILITVPDFTPGQGEILRT